MKDLISLIKQHDDLTCRVFEEMESVTNGRVYVLYNESMPGIYKIGKTKNSSSLRAKQLSSSTGVPTEFKVLFDISVALYSDVELMIHADLDKHRSNSKREFFECDLDIIMTAFSECIQSSYARMGVYIDDSHRSLFEDLLIDIEHAKCLVEQFKTGVFGKNIDGGFKL